MRKLTFLVGAGAGFVMGSKIGHGPYQKLDATARNLLGRPEIQQRLDQVARAAPGPLGDAASKVTERLSASSDGSDATTETVLKNSEWERRTAS